MLGTNSLEGLGFKITHSDGSVVESDTTDEKGETVSPKESSDESITNTKDCGKSDKSSTNTLERSVTSNQDCGKSVESALPIIQKGQSIVIRIAVCQRLRNPHMTRNGHQSQCIMLF